MGQCCSGNRESGERGGSSPNSNKIAPAPEGEDTKALNSPAAPGTKGGL